MNEWKDRINKRLFQIASTKDSGYWAQRYEEDCKAMLAYIRGQEQELELMYSIHKQHESSEK